MNPSPFESDVKFRPAQAACLMEGYLPLSWYRSYLRPIVFLTNGFSTDTMNEVVNRNLQLGPHGAASIAKALAREIRRRYGVEIPLPPVAIRIVEGDLSDWRRKRGHFLAVRCNGCALIHPAYWMETPEDERRAERIEQGHPAMPFMPPRQLVTFHHGNYVGCYCSKRFDRHDPGYDDERFHADVEELLERLAEERVRTEEPKEDRRETA